MSNADQLLAAMDRLGRPQLLVLGDLILDRYTWGDAERISQEAPVLVLRATDEEVRCGGAANVCAMLRGLQVDVSCVGLVGADADGRELLQLFDRQQIDRQGVLIDAGRPTTVKQRFMGRSHLRHANQILRVDRELRDPIGADLEQQLIQHIASVVDDFDALLISDYAKGVCSERLVREVIAQAASVGCPVLVDPPRAVDYQRFRGATLLKPNRSETAAATGQAIDNGRQALEAGRQLVQQLNLELAVITLDRDGMAMVSADGSGHLFPTRAREVYDITGAGDVVLATLGMCLASGTSNEVAVQLSNLAGGLEVQHAGVRPISRDEIRDELVSQRHFTAGKVLTVEQLSALTRRHRQQGNRVVFTNGCFDLLHVGHVSYLTEAAALGDKLIVAVNSDASVRRLKGSSRPVIGQYERAAMLAALECVDYVVIFDEDTPHRILDKLRPDVLVKGGTYRADQVVGREVVDGYGGRVAVLGLVDGISTTHIVRTIADRQGPLRDAG